jgi:hypothetical protein
MENMVIGAIVLALTGISFWYMLPRGGKYHRFVGTELEPFIGVAFTAAVALSLTMMLSGAISYFGWP